MTENKTSPKKHKGIVVKTFNKDGLVPAAEAEVLSTGDKETLAVDRIEEELETLARDLLEVKKQKGFLKTLLGGDPRKREVEDLKLSLTKIQTVREIHDECTALETQMYNRRKNLLTAKTSLLQKQVMSTKEAQKLIAQRELRQLRIDAMKKETEELDVKKYLERKRKEVETPADDQQKKDPYDLADFDTLTEEPADAKNGQGGDEA